MTRSALTLAAAALLLAAGCGGGDDPGRTVTVPASNSVRVAAKEYRFDPSTLVVRSAGTLKIMLDNTGSLAHDIEVRDGDRVVGGTPPIRAGEQRWTTMKVASGTYEFLCTVGDHAELGMKGKLKVD